MKIYIKRLLCFFLISMLSITLVACGPKPEESVKSFFAAIQKQDLKTAANFIDNSDTSKLSSSDQEQEKIIKQIFSKVKYEIVSSTVSGDTAKVKTKITSPDLVKITSKMITELLPTLFASALSGKTDQSKTDQLFEDYYTKSLSAQDAPVTTSEVNLNLVKSKDKKTWLIQGNDDLMAALTGNLSKAFDSLSKQTSADTNKTKNPTPDSKLYAIGEQATYGRASITVKKVEKSSGSDYDKPKDGMTFVIVTINEKNTGNNGNIAYNPFNFKMQNSKGQIIDTSFTTIDQNTALHDGSLVPNGEIEGTLVFEEPKDDSNLTFMFVEDQQPLLKFQIK